MSQTCTFSRSHKVTVVWLLQLSAVCSAVLTAVKLPASPSVSQSTAPVGFSRAATTAATTAATAGGGEVSRRGSGSPRGSLPPRPAFAGAVPSSAGEDDDGEPTVPASRTASEADLAAIGRSGADSDSDLPTPSSPSSSLSKFGRQRSRTFGGHALRAELPPPSPNSILRGFRDDRSVDELGGDADADAAAAADADADAAGGSTASGVAFPKRSSSGSFVSNGAEPFTAFAQPSSWFVPMLSVSASTSAVFAEVAARTAKHAQLQPVTDVVVVHKGDAVPPGFSKLSTSIGGHLDANLNRGSGGRTLHLCVKRSAGTPVTGVTIIYLDKGEFVPPGFHPVCLASTGEPANLNAGNGGHEAYLCLFRGPGSAVLDVGVWFPQEVVKATGATESLPDGYNFVDRTPLGHPADLSSSRGKPIRFCFLKDVRVVCV